ncbi:MAG: helix-turn-helix domain-containing protein [Phycisphaeraceae bacterium]|nr:helix-turn-helix domain-containing protein [Phycisphaeraceae bacterium]
MLRVHRNTVHRERESGRLGHLRIGRRVLFTPGHVAAFLEQQSLKGGPCSTNRSGSTRATSLSSGPTHPTTASTGTPSAGPDSPLAAFAEARARATLHRQSRSSSSLSARCTSSDR